MTQLDLSSSQAAQYVQQVANDIGWGPKIMSVFSLNFGDPELITSVASKWAAAYTKVGAARGFLSNPAVLTPAKATWTGAGATAFFAGRDTLESGYLTVQTGMKTVHDQLDAVAASITDIFGKALSSITSASLVIAGIIAGAAVAAAALAAAAPAAAAAVATITIFGVPVETKLVVDIIGVLGTLIESIINFHNELIRFNDQVATEIDNINAAEGATPNQGLANGKLLPAPTTTTP
jgi:uncharacterized protein YukE